MPTIFSPVRIPVNATSDGSGNITFTFPFVTPQTVWRGSAFIDQAPASASVRIGTGVGTTIGYSWGSTTGGGALNVEALAGEQIVITATGMAVTTTYTAYFTGNELHEETAAGVGYLSPFPSTTH